MTIDDTCDSIAAMFGTFSTSDFISWNPSVWDDCSQIKVCGLISLCLISGCRGLLISEAHYINQGPVLVLRRNSRNAKNALHTDHDNDNSHHCPQADWYGGQL